MMMVELWMSTLLPVFWITVLKPLELAKEPEEMKLAPLLTLTAALPATAPWTRDWPGS